MLVLMLGLQVGVADPSSEPTVPTTVDAFFLAGSQPDGDVVYETFRSAASCQFCHRFDDSTELLIHSKWQGSMMAHAAEDPLFRACLAIANQDAAFAGDICIRCHSPGGWISGRSTPTDGSALTGADLEGVGCSVCHRMVDPEYKPGVSPVSDGDILANIDPLPVNPGSGNFVLDPNDVRRGPFGLEDDLAQPGHLWAESPFHTTSELCAHCHDVSNPVYMRQSDGSYALTDFDQPHPTGDKHDMFPIERTYSEWLHSDFADGGVDMGGRFGGNKTVVSTCQDCHMPDSDGEACNHPDAVVRANLPSHELSGGNAWMLDALITLCDPADPDRPAYCPPGGFNVNDLMDGRDRAVSMLQRAATVEVTQQGNYIRVRVVNETGHKLPSGYPEGRRMWLNVALLDGSEFVLAEHGFYDDQTADLTTYDTKVYEAHLGLDAAAAAATGLREGKSFHFVLNNVFLKDNRIPPRGFANAAFRSVGPAPAGCSYTDGQYWDDTRYRLPDGAVRAVVRLYYQTASKEYVTFLRDENRTNDAGDVLYDLWERTGKSPPVLMAEQTIEVGSFVDGDWNEDGFIDLADYVEFMMCDGGPSEGTGDPECEAFDFDADGDVDLRDFGELQINF